MRNTRRKTKIKLPAQIEWIECLFLNKLKDKKNQQQQQQLPRKCPVFLRESN